MANDTTVRDFSEVKPPEGEWHRTPENEEIIGKVVARVWGISEEMVLVAHHICFRDRQRQKVEIASAETLIFDPVVLDGLFGTEWGAKAMQLALARPEVRLGLIKSWMDAMGEWC